MVQQLYFLIYDASISFSDIVCSKQVMSNRKFCIHRQWLGHNSKYVFPLFPLFTTHLHLLFLEGDKSLRIKYFITIELASDLQYLTEDACSSIKPFLDRFQATA